MFKRGRIDKLSIPSSLEKPTMRIAKPFYWESRKGWYVNLPNGEKKRLTPKGVYCAKSDGAAQRAALQEYHTLMAGRQPLGKDCRALDLFGRFLAHHEKSADETHRFYAVALDKEQAGSFARYIGNRRVSGLKARDVEDWIDRGHRTRKDGKPTSDNYRRNLIRAVKAAFRWAEQREEIDRSPVRGVKLPTPQARMCT